VGLVGNAGVANYVKKTPGAIGSVELVFAERNQLTQASIRNAAGVYVKANNASITAALATAEVPPDFRLSIVNSRGSGAYPIANVTWMLVFANGAAADRAKTAALVAFLRWVVSDGQKIAEASHFAPLSSGLRERVLQEIGTIPVPN
jgi:phosphate transport system substrate-binding protein